MTEFIFITANDIHISDQSPRSRIDNFKETVLNKIGQMGTVCNRLNADAALIAGDLFNYKNPAKNSHRLNQDLIKEFKKFNCPIYMIEGNHDLTGNHIESLSDQPLGVLFTDGTLKQLREEIIEKDGKKISLVGVPYTENLDLTDLNIPNKDGFISQICLMHIYASLKSGFLFNERLYGYDELSELSPDIFVIGHYHTDQGIYKNKEKHFINIGAMTRGTLSDENLEHRPQIGYIKIQAADNSVKYEIQSIALKVKPYNEIFDIEKREEEKKETKEIELFVEKLISETIEETKDSKESIDSLIDKLKITDEVRKRVLSFIQEASVRK